MFHRIVNFLANLKYFRSLTSRLMRLFFFVDIPPSVVLKGKLVLAHGGMGVVIHPATEIGNNVKIYQQVTIGRSDIFNENPTSDFEGITIEDNVIIGAGAKIITKKQLKIGKGTIIGANSVLTSSTGENEIWAGAPAKPIENR